MPIREFTHLHGQRVSDHDSRAIDGLTPTGPENPLDIFNVDVLLPLMSPEREHSGDIFSKGDCKEPTFEGLRNS